MHGSPNIGDIQKKDVMEGLQNAARSCKKKGKYSKGIHSFRILEKIDTDKVFLVSRHARLLIQAIKEGSECISEVASIEPPRS
ncbi:MAG: hypothetical protein OXD44_03815 [Gammaproteobacteria bacterium]|nr:hypothetical protein [Gammaproteobacteria bacterium]